MARRGYQLAQGESLLKMIRSVTDCADCNGTGADYDDACRAVACRSCGGSGWIETQAENDTPQAHSPQDDTLKGIDPNG